MPREKSTPIPISQVELKYCDFGNVLRQLIKLKGYTQEGFAEAIGVSYSTMMRILRGDRRVYLHVYMKMLDVLGICDLAIMSKFSNQPDLYEKAQLYMRLVSKMDKIPLNVLNRIEDLFNETDMQD